MTLRHHVDVKSHRHYHIWQTVQRCIKTYSSKCSSLIHSHMNYAQALLGKSNRITKMEKKLLCCYNPLAFFYQMQQLKLYSKKYLLDTLW